jgi:hypothetical protein
VGSSDYLQDTLLAPNPVRRRAAALQKRIMK